MRRLLLFLCLAIEHCILHCAQQAVTIVPVADLLGDSRGPAAYNSLPLCAKPVTSCSRVHQLLFNEIVTIEEEKGPEVRVTISSIFYEKNPHGTPQATYWTLKKNILTFDQLKKFNIPLETIPEPVNFQNKSINQCENIISLMFPHYDNQTKKTYSAGTRFVLSNNQQRSEEFVTVYAINEHSPKLMQISLPKSKVISCPNKFSPAQQQQLFLKLVRTWAHQSNGFIPYVWGGSSFTNLCHGAHFLQKAENHGAIRFDLAHEHCQPHSGFDCAGLIARAAQLSGMPFFFKNTATILNHLQEIKSPHQIENGDLIWFPGHVILISQLDENKIIEARAYGQGYGKIHELTVKEVFKDIDTIEQLFLTAAHKKTVYRLQKDGNVAHEISNLKMLKLASIWK